MATHSTDYGTEGIISANNIELISIRVLDKYNKAPLSRVLEALQWCIENDVDIVNMSFGTNVHVETFYRMIQEVANQNILMIAAVGNQGEQEQKSVQYPARYSQVMGVGAVNERMKRSTFSSYGSGVAVVAPGENIPVSSLLGDGWRRKWNELCSTLCNSNRCFAVVYRSYKKCRICEKRIRTGRRFAWQRIRIWTGYFEL